MFALISLSRLVAAVVPGWLGSGLKEGLVIASWIVMWRPSEILIYDWIPCRHERKVASKLFAAPIQVRSDNGPAPGSRDSVAAERVTQA
ncbi:MAG: hypothetical protein ABI704_05865 [Kofleriaceae bacterium]